MKKEISLSDFMREFSESSYKNNFSREGLRVLYDYLTELEEDTGTEINLDIVVICCDFNEYEDLGEYLRDYENQHEDALKELKEEFFEEMQNDKEFKNQWENPINQEETFREWVYKYHLDRFEEEITQNTTLIKEGNDLNEPFIIQRY